MIQLDIVSDPICPWCYIGKHRLRKAIAAAGRNPFSIVWRPFQLNPEMPPEGMDRRSYLDAKFGKDTAARFYQQIEDTAAADGLPVNFAAISRTPNTIDAHRLIRWSFEPGKQDAVVDALFDRYFVQGQDISDHVVLLDAAEACGLERDVIARLLASDAEIETIRAEDAEARKIGVTGVPTFIVANRHVVSGAQPPELWSQVIDDILAQLAQAEAQGPAT